MSGPVVKKRTVAIAKPPDRHSRPQARNSSRVLGRFSLYLVAMGVAGCFLTMFAVRVSHQAGALASLRTQRDALQQQLDKVQQQGNTLHGQLSQLNNDQYIEQMARQYGYIKDGEIRLVPQSTTDAAHK